MSSPVLTEFDQLTIQQSFAAACGLTALHFVLEAYPDEKRRQIKEDIVKQWRGSWKESFQSYMDRYMAVMRSTTNSHQLDQPEDFQQAFNAALAEAERVGRISLRLDI